MEELTAQDTINKWIADGMSREQFINRPENSFYLKEIEAGFGKGCGINLIMGGR